MFIPEASAATFLSDTDILDGPVKDFDVRLSEAWDDFRFRRTSDAEKRGLNWAYDRYVDDIHKATGVRLDNPMVDPGGMRAGGELRLSRRAHAGDGAGEDILGAPPMFSGPSQDTRIAAFHAKVDELAAAHPALRPRSSADLHAEIADEAKRRKAALETGTDVGWAGLGRFMGEAGGAMTDPVNVMSMVLTGGWNAAAPVGGGMRAMAAHLGKSAAINAGAGAVTETAIQPLVMGYNRSLGIDYSLGDAAESVFGAAVGGAVLGTGIEATLRGSGALWRTWSKARAKGRVPDSAEAFALDARLGDEALVDEANPWRDWGIAGQAAHGDAVAAATEQMLHGRPVDVDAITAEVRQLSRAWDEVDLAPLGLTDDPLVKIRPNDIEEALREVVVERGPVLETVGANGNPDLPGEVSVQIKGMRGWGIVKFQWKHGPKSKVPTQYQIGKEHLLMFPRVIRELTPEPFPKDNPTHWEWRLTEDHPEYGKRQIVWGASKHTEADGNTRLVTLYIQEPNRAGAGKPDSALRKSGAPGTPSEVFSPTRDTTADLASRLERSQSAPAPASIAQSGVSAKVSALRERVGLLNDRLSAVEGELKRRADLGEPAALDDPLHVERNLLRADITAARREAETAPLPPMLRQRPARKPWRLAYWLARQGGLKEDAGELAARDAARHIPGLVNNKGGMDFDTAALRAWEAGYLPGDERPSVNDFLDLLDHDLRTKRVFSQHDDDAVAALDAHDQLHQAVTEAGIDARGMTDGELLSSLYENGMRQAERDARALDWRAAEVHQDVDAALIRDARRLLDDAGDIDIAVEVAEVEGVAQTRTRSARELMDEADREMEGLDAFQACMFGGKG